MFADMARPQEEGRFQRNGSTLQAGLHIDIAITRWLGIGSAIQTYKHWRISHLGSTCVKVKQTILAFVRRKNVNIYICSFTNNASTFKANFF